MKNRRKQPENLRLRSVLPTLTVDDMETSLAFYRDVLGFVVSDTIEADGRVVGASVRSGSVEILLGQDDFQRGRDRKKGVGFRLYCVSYQDVDAMAERIEANGGRLDEGPSDQPWGSRDFSITDPDGFKISVSSPMPD